MTGKTDAEEIAAPDAKRLEHQPDFEREKWLAQIEIQREQLDLQRRDQKNKDRELHLKQLEAERSRWNNPLVVAIMAAAIAGLASVVGSAVSDYFQRRADAAKAEAAHRLESEKSESVLILEMLKTGDLRSATSNLRFLLDTGLVTNPGLVQSIKKYQRDHPDNGPVLPTPAGANSVRRGPKIWTGPIPVCWEPDSADSSRDQKLVEEAIRSTWQDHSGVRFVGWTTCSPASRGARIQVRDEAPGTKSLGPDLDGVPNGVTLNFLFKNYAQECSKSEASRRQCIVSYSVHVFGHVLGLTHEDERPDAPPNCPSPRNFDAISILQYDPNSVMNQCNPVFSNNGILSGGDVAKVQFLYGLPAR